MQAALHLMPVLSFIQAFLYYAAQPAAAAPAPAADASAPVTSNLPEETPSAEQPNAGAP